MRSALEQLDDVMKNHLIEIVEHSGATMNSIMAMPPDERALADAAIRVGE